MELVSIFSAAGQLEAEMIKGFLTAQGIDVILNQESIGRTLGLSAGRLGEVDILVPQSQEQEARQLLAAMEAGDYEDPNDSEDLNEEDGTRTDT